MRLLLDESLPRQLGRELGGHEVTTVAQQGWAGLENGELIRRGAAEGFAALLAGDQSIQYQQDVATLGIGIVVLSARSAANTP